MTDLLLALWIDCEPPMRSGQRLRIIRLGKRFGVAQTAEYKRNLQGIARLLFAHLPADWTPLDAPVLLRLDIVVPHRQSEPAARRGLYVPFDVTPDADNVCKFYGDAIEQAGIVVNDKLLHPAIFRWWGPRPGLRIRLWPLTPQVSLDQVGGLAFAQENA